MVHVTRLRPFLGWFTVHWLVLATVNLPTALPNLKSLSVLIRKAIQNIENRVVWVVRVTQGYWK